ncbi:hypothetical protein HYH03_013832 [Edaphochlamys debaryana]|uniref:Kinesin light chain n=1 Tax=Edaphochlamys debaryana TaxID=47281 RepID=A0A835XRD1_9CHLO|nr:hypothetical protein HYH03_013832 [Edaphochlamys debaryana]|eukprot:KAG2487553.1 hypothetical protein HYH03_013832 [Edaphochlamys debaryana]
MYRARSACRLIGAVQQRCAGAGAAEQALSYSSVALLRSDGVGAEGRWAAATRASAGTGGTSGGQATSRTGWAAALLAAAAASTATSLADSPAQPPAAPLPEDDPARHPLDYDPVTNEHTAKMTLARKAAIEYYNAGKYQQAEAKFREAVAEAELGFDAGDPHLASTRNNLAEFLRNTGRFEEAEALYREALELLETTFGEKHWLYVSALHNLALSYEAKGDLPTAIATMERVLALRLQMFGTRHFMYGDALYALGHLRRKAAPPGPAGAKARAEGVGMMEDAVAILEDAEKVQLNVALFWLSEIAQAHTADGRPAAAAAALRRAVRHLAADRGDDPAAASALQDALIEALMAAGRPAQAAEAAAEALAARRKLFGEGALVVANSEVKLATLELTAAQVSPASGSPGGADASGGPGPALRALQHAEAATRVATAVAEEGSKGSMFSGPPPDKVIKRLRAAHTLGAAAKLVATLAGVGDPSVPSAPAPSSSSPSSSSGPSSSSPSTSASAPAKPSAAAASGSSWWPFGGGSKAAPGSAAIGSPSGSAAAAAVGGADGGAPAAPLHPRPPAQPVAELALADRRLEAAVAALEAATGAGRELLQAVASGRRQLPQGVTSDEVAGLLVEAQLQMLDVLERLGLVLQARVAAGQVGGGSGQGGGGGGKGDDVVARHRRVVEQQERVAEALLG